ncbi:FtsX-like permease family protein [Streptomyces sp. Caat 7-52]|uniref:FtsX-like permease family protein n=1 Tax=Streptomyces sp. Caat 7-52 TaxID=2949637 RepID=UPI002034A7BD|nr:FtsX-like permease family protein [Streptomyces sp. Caat 7-52]
MGRPAPRTPAVRVPPVAAPWVRTRLRAAPGAAAALALLVALTACLAGAFPRAVDRYEDAGLHRALRQARPEHTTVRVSVPQPDPGLPAGQRARAMRPEVLERQFRKVLGTVDSPLAVDRAQSAYGVAGTVSPAVPDPWLPRPTGLPARVSLAAQSGLARHAHVRTGRLPRAAHPVDGTTPEVEAAVTAATAKGLHIRVGSVIHVPAPGRPPLAVRITGIVVPHDPDGAYWSTVPLLRTPTLVTLPTPGPDPDKYWLGALLLAPEAAPALLGTGTNPARYWHLAPDLRGLHAHDLDRLKPAVAALESGPALQRARAVTDYGADIGTDLDDTLASFSRLRSGISPLVSVAAAGTATVVAVVLLMAGGLAADRRRAELALLRARGASLSGLAGRLLAETAVAALPAGGLGLAVALLAVPAGRTGPAVAAALATTLTACAALPLRAALAHRTVRLTAPREDVTSLRPSRRRTVAELTLLVLAVGAVATLRRRGTTGDQLVAVAPVLVGVIAALLLLRLHPLLLRRLSGPAGRLRGAIGHLSLARAGRTQASAVLPLLALLTALTTAAFGGSVLAGVAEARDRAALLTVGADARADSGAPLPAAAPARVRAVPGVRAATAVSISYQAKPADGQDSVPLVGVDPRAYGELAARTGAGAFPAGRLTARSHTLTAIATPSGTLTAVATSSRTLPTIATPSGTLTAVATPSGTLTAVATPSGTLTAVATPSRTLPTIATPSGTLTAVATPSRTLPTIATPSGTLAAVASPSVASAYGTRRPFPVRLEDGSTVTVRIVLVRDRTPAVTGPDFLVVDRAGLGAVAGRPTALLVTGAHLDAGALRRAVGGAAAVRTRADERARYADSPLQTGAEHVYTAAVAAGAGFAVLALLLALLRAAPERAALLARLRTMGLTRAEGRRLLILESLPQALLAALGGAVTGWAAIRLLAPGVDLTTIALPSATAPAVAAELHPDTWSLTVPALLVLTVSTGIAALQAWWSGRRGSVTELRAGDSR